jgi:arylsulfatase A-like enzyme
MARPNIILLFCDQLRGDALGCYGNPVCSTPNLDYLAAAGTRFENAYSAVPSCLPARANLWSGQEQWHTGVLGMGRGQGQTPNDFPHTLAGELTAAGYRTHLVGKGHFHPQRALMGFQSEELDESGRTLINGFKDEYRAWFDEHAPEAITPDDHGVYWNSWHARPWHTEEYLHPTSWTMTRALDFLDNRDPDQPFFLNISFARPHSPYVPPRVYWDRYINEDLPPAHIGNWSRMHEDPRTACDPNAWRGRMPDRDIHRARAGYYGEVSFIDTQIGRLINHLSRFHPQAMRNTWILFTADHGDMLGDHNLWRKTYAYEGSTHIPFLVVPPPAERGGTRKVAEEVVELRDVMPTLLGAAGVDVPNTVDGCDLRGLLTAPAKDWREYIHGEHCTCYSPDQEMQYVTDGRRKLVWLPRRNQMQFFDLEEDRGEIHDLIDDPAREEEIARWQGYLVQELERRDCGWVKDGKPCCPDDKPLVSPYRDQRWTGPTE